MMPEFLRSLRNSTIGGMSASSLTFFEPNDAFFAALEPFKDAAIVDAGAGMGHVSSEGLKRGFKMLPIDIMPRQGQAEEVVLLEAETMPYGPHLSLLMCRPDHSGWAYDTLEIALKRGAKVFYAGLERNFECDLGEYVGREAQRWSNVGEEGEDLFLFLPDSLLPPEDY